MKETVLVLMKTVFEFESNTNVCVNFDIEIKGNFEHTELLANKTNHISMFFYKQMFLSKIF